MVGGAAGRAAAAAAGNPAASLTERSDGTHPSAHAHRGYTEYKQEMQSLGKPRVTFV